MSTLSEVLKKPVLSYGSITPPQQLAIDSLYEGNRLLIAQVGFGKAVVGQTAVQELLADGEVSRVLVVAPLKVCQLTWSSEWKTWDHLYQPAMAIGDEDARRAVIDSDAPIVVMNFDNLAWFFATYRDAHGFDGLLIDEISKLKNVGGKMVKAMRPRLKAFKWRAGMSATPVAEAGTDIYSQALIVDGGEALGRNKEKFMRRYFYPTDFEQRKWEILPGHAPLLAEALKDVLVVADDLDYQSDLPELRDRIVNVEMPASAWKVYAEVRDEMYSDVGDGPGVEADNQAVVTGKLQQITAGAIYDDDRATAYLHQAKIRALTRLLPYVEGPVLVAYAFEFEKQMLREAVPGIEFMGANSNDLESLLERWNAGEVPVMAVHPRSASHGINAQYGGHELIVLTIPWGADPWQQLVGRLRRRGQRSAYVRRTTLVVPGTVDEQVMERHLEKRYCEVSLMAEFASRGA